MSSPPPSEHVRTQALSARQERRLLDYIDDSFLDITRNFRKRTLPSSTLPTLHAYIDAAHALLALVLQIPPAAPAQAALRTALLLRLTADVLASVPGYPPHAPALPHLLALLAELDSGWCAVLRAQAWDPRAREGVDVDVDVPLPPPTPSSDLLARAAPPVSQTDRTRLRSILVGGATRLEEWLENGLRVDGAGDQDLGQALERLGLQQAFDDLFVRTLSEMGEFTEAMARVDVPPLLSTC